MRRHREGQGVQGRSATRTSPGKWLVLYSYPKDFTFVCPTEIVEFDKKLKDFADRDAVVLGGSTDNEFSHLAWRKDHADLKTIHHPLLFWTPAVAHALGILHPEAGVALRATLIVDPDGIVRFVVRERPLGRPQRGRGPARPRRPADRRAVPLQLEEGRRDAHPEAEEGGLTAASRSGRAPEMPACALPASEIPWLSTRPTRFARRSPTSRATSSST